MISELDYNAARACPKCAHIMVTTLYVADTHDYRCSDHRGGGDCCTAEHFHRCCQRCHYEWAENVLVPEDQEALFAFKCHLCGKEKWSISEVNALRMLAFHYDRRHRGWTNPDA